MRICVTGGAGYVGSSLVPFLLAQGHDVIVLDTFWYGDFLPSHKNLVKIQGDIRDSVLLRQAFTNQDAVIHLACISNDPSFDMNPRLGEEINYTCFRNILDLLKEQKVKRFIYASSSSVYGLSDALSVTEETEKKPLTDYSKYKLMCEEELIKYGTAGTWTIIRPATVCGYSPRMRLDLVVNIFTIHALVNKKIILFGRMQKRPNINIGDMCRAYAWALSQNEALVHEKIYNVGFENLRLDQIAQLVKLTLKEKHLCIVERPVEDKRSYHINSDKILKDGFCPEHTIRDAITSIQQNFNSLKCPMVNADYYNIKKMKELGLT